MSFTDIPIQIARLLNFLVSSIIRKDLPFSKFNTIVSTDSSAGSIICGDKQTQTVNTIKLTE